MDPESKKSPETLTAILEELTRLNREIEELRRMRMIVDEVPEILARLENLERRIQTGAASAGFPTSASSMDADETLEDRLDLTVSLSDELDPIEPAERFMRVTASDQLAPLSVASVESTIAHPELEIAPSPPILADESEAPSIPPDADPRHVAASEATESSRSILAAGVELASVAQSLFGKIPFLGKAEDKLAASAQSAGHSQAVAPVESTPTSSPAHGPTMPEALGISPALDEPEPVSERDWAAVEAGAVVWGTRVGALIVTLGLGYLLSHGIALLGAVGKTILVYAAAAGMLAGGLIIERRERYATWAKIVMACGWASLYATTFLIHILPGEAQLIKSPLIDMSLLAVIASGMIGHSFKYRSQQLTMTAYFIGFAGIAFTAHWAQQQFFSLVAGLVLGVSGVVVFGVMQWHRLMLLCLIGAYAVHGLWLHHMFGLFTTPVGHSAEFRPGLIITFLEWAAFTAALFVNRPEDEESELITLATATLNFALCVVLIKLQSSGQ